MPFVLCKLEGEGFGVGIAFISLNEYRVNYPAAFSSLPTSRYYWLPCAPKAGRQNSKHTVIRPNPNVKLL